MDKMPKPDYMSEAEYTDLENMKDEVIKLKVRMWDYLTDVQRLDAKGLQTSGYSKYTNAQAIEKILCETNVKIAKMHNDHIKKYPD